MPRHTPAHALASAKRQDKSLFETNPLVAIGVLLQSISAGVQGKKQPFAGLSRDAAALLADDRKARLDELRGQKLRQETLIAALKAIGAAGPEAAPLVAESLAASMGGSPTAEQLLQMSAQEPSALQESLNFSSFQDQVQIVLQEALGAGQALTKGMDSEQLERFSAGLDEEFPADPRGTREIDLDAVIQLGEDSGMPFSETQVAAAEKRSALLAGQGLTLDDGTKLTVSVPSLGELTAQTAIEARAKRPGPAETQATAAAEARGEAVTRKAPALLGREAEAKAAGAVRGKAAGSLTDFVNLAMLGRRAANQTIAPTDFPGVDEARLTAINALDPSEAETSAEIMASQMSKSGLNVEFFTDEAGNPVFNITTGPRGGMTDRLKQQLIGQFDNLSLTRDMGKAMLSLLRESGDRIAGTGGRVKRFGQFIFGSVRSLLGEKKVQSFIQSAQQLVGSEASKGNKDAIAWLAAFDAKVDEIDQLSVAFQFAMARAERRGRFPTDVALRRFEKLFAPGKVSEARQLAARIESAIIHQIEPQLKQLGKRLGRKGDAAPPRKIELDTSGNMILRDKSGKVIGRIGPDGKQLLDKDLQ